MGGHGREEVTPASTNLFAVCNIQLALRTHPPPVGRATGGRLT